MTENNKMANKQETNVLAIVSLVCGILSFVALGLIGAIAAIITGVMAKKEIIRTKQQGIGFAKAGMILGIVNIGISIIAIIILIVFFASVASIAAL